MEGPEDGLGDGSNESDNVGIEEMLGPGETVAGDGEPDDGRTDGNELG